VLPLLGRAAHAVRVTSGADVIWDPGWEGAAAAAGVRVSAAAAVDGVEELRLQLGPGGYAFVVRDR
jgi:hypothetical protein